MIRKIQIAKILIQTPTFFSSEYYPVSLNIFCHSLFSFLVIYSLSLLFLSSRLFSSPSCWTSLSAEPVSVIENEATLIFSLSHFKWQATAFRPVSIKDGETLTSRWLFAHGNGCRTTAHSFGTCYLKAVCPKMFTRSGWNDYLDIKSMKISRVKGFVRRLSAGLVESM